MPRLPAGAKSVITFIFGPNTYVSAQAVAEHAAAYTPGDIERHDGSELGIHQLPDLFQGMSLFTAQRLVIIKEASANKPLWEALPEWLGRIPDEIHIVFIETTPDKRTKTFKAFQKQATAITSELLNEAQAAEWLKEEAIRRSGNISAPSARLLVEYIGTDQWQLAHELEKLLLVEDTSVERIKATVEPTPHASAFALLDAALAGRIGEMREFLKQCETLEDPYRLFGLLSNQAYQLAVVASAKGKSAEAIAKDIGAHPYPVKKLQTVARRLSPSEIAQVVDAVAMLDDQMKRTVADPWLLIERALVRIATK